jgi:HSP20 family molecular chaperone IbpA
MSVRSDSKDSFRMLAGIASKSFADPPWFATPVNAEEDEDSVTVTFHVRGKIRSPVRVQVGDQSLTVWGDPGRDQRRPMRLCALPCPVVASQTETTQIGDLLRVRVPKKRPVVDSRETSPTT